MFGDDSEDDSSDYDSSDSEDEESDCNNSFWLFLIFNFIEF